MLDVLFFDSASSSAPNVTVIFETSVTVGTHSFLG